MIAAEHILRPTFLEPGFTNAKSMSMTCSERHVDGNVHPVSARAPDTHVSHYTSMESVIQSPCVDECSLLEVLKAAKPAPDLVPRLVPNVRSAVKFHVACSRVWPKVSHQRTPALGSRTRSSSGIFAHSLLGLRELMRQKREWRHLSAPKESPAMIYPLATHRIKFGGGNTPFARVS